MVRLFSAASAALSSALIAATLGFGGAAAAAESGVYKLDKTHASVIWSVQHLGLSNYTARFDEFDIKLTLDVDDVTKSSVSATIDPRSVNTGFPGEKDFNAEISDDGRFFNAAEFPEVTFASTSIERTGESTATITGDLTILGVTRPITLEAELVGALDAHPLAGTRPAVGFSATGVFDRTTFGMDAFSNSLGEGGPPIVSPEVTVTINAEFIKAE